MTLDQYRTNDNVCISAEVGDEVKASADGVVSEIVRDDLLGNYVVIDHENGWRTTYSQLAEINCSVGEAVSAEKLSEVCPSLPFIPRQWGLMWNLWLRLMMFR